MKPLFIWLYAAVPITILCLGMYAVGQQNYRQNANDPQIQMAEDGATKLNAGGVPADLVTRGAPLTDIATSLDPWIAVYDSSGLPLEASAQLDNAPPQPPKRLFDDSGWIDPKTYFVPPGKETRVTWQPKEGVRQAIVIVHASSGRFVVAGRSLRLSEERTGVLGFNMLIGWLGALVVMAGVQLVYVFGRGIARRGARGG